MTRLAPTAAELSPHSPVPPTHRMQQSAHAAERAAPTLQDCTKPLGLSASRGKNKSSCAGPGSVAHAPPNLPLLWGESRQIDMHATSRSTAKRRLTEAARLRPPAQRALLQQRVGNKLTQKVFTQPGKLPETTRHTFAESPLVPVALRGFGGMATATLKPRSTATEKRPQRTSSTCTAQNAAQELLSAMPADSRGGRQRKSHREAAAAQEHRDA